MTEFAEASPPLQGLQSPGEKHQSSLPPPKPPWASSSDLSLPSCVHVRRLRRHLKALFFEGGRLDAQGWVGRSQRSPVPRRQLNAETLSAFGFHPPFSSWAPGPWAVASLLPLLVSRGLDKKRCPAGFLQVLCVSRPGHSHQFVPRLWD